MLRQRYAALIAAASLPMLAGCVQATRHSNTMVFGTNTTFGVKAGTAVGEAPEIVVGYDRQEAVIMPLVANTKDSSGSNSNRLGPCDLSKDVSVQGNSDFAVHPCSLVAVNGKALDSYSVLASFGAQFDATGSGAKGGLAQYFSTGIASQLLAATGGAAVVATGNAAAISAAKTPDANQTIQSLYGDEPEFQLGVAEGDAYNAFKRNLAAKIQLTPKANLANRMRAFEQAVGSPFQVALACDEKETCAQSADSAFAVSYSPAYDQALAAWATD